MQSVWVSMVFFALVGGITPGPVNVMASSLGARWGWAGAWPHVLGASLAYCVMVGAMGSGLQLVLSRHPALARYTQYAGAAYLLYLSVRIGTAAPSTGVPSGGAANMRPGTLQGVWGGFWVQALNPKGWLVAMSGVGMFVAGAADESLYLIVFCAISLTVCFAAVSVWAGLGLAIQAWMRQAPFQRWFNRACGLALAACVGPMFSGA